MAKVPASGKKARGSAPGPSWGVTRERASHDGPQTPNLEGKEMPVQGGSPWRGSGGTPSLSSPERRSYITQALAELVPGLTRAAYRRRSPAGALLMSEWAAIVGPRLSMETAPKKFVGGTLTIACSGAMAMEMQHLSAALIERINGHAGQALVQRLRFVQEPVAPPSVPVKRRVVAPVPLTELPQGELNDALARLRAAIRTK